MNIERDVLDRPGGLDRRWAHDRFDERLRAAGPDARMRLHDSLYRQAFDLV